MKRKYLILILLAALNLALIGVVVRTQQHLSVVDGQLQNMSQAYGRLNDQLVALQSYSKPDNTSSKNVQTSGKNNAKSLSQADLAATGSANLNTTSPIAVENTKAMLLAQLELVQFALKQQQYVYALEKLKAVQNAVPKQPLAMTLQQSLIHGLLLDQKNIQQQVERLQQQQRMLFAALGQIDLQIQQMMLQTPNIATRHESWWKNWLILERASTDNPQLHNRIQIYQELQWRLQLAQQAQLQGQYVLCQQQLMMAQRLFNRVPDAAGRHIQQQLSHLQRQPRLAMPQLQSMMLLR